MANDEQKSPEAKEAERKAVDEQGGETPLEIDQLLKDASVLSKEFDPAAPDPTLELYEQHEARLQEEAAILEEACAIVLPEIKLVAKPIRAAFTESEPSENQAELESLSGSLPARYRQTDWLDLPAFQLDGATNYLGAFTDAQDGDSGVFTSKGSYLLVDGRLVEVHGLGTWRVMGNDLRNTRHTIVSTREVTSKEVVSDASMTDLFMKLRRSLHLGLEALEGQHVPDLAERRTRLDEIVVQYIAIVRGLAEGLRRVGDSPA
ncbi:MAG: hypothetical protein ACJ8AT_35845 [Hyalangium sp.]|uniref:hypothetical protein n=1 Tax=Hyalangium sp. TaxID=2028555 RepID=UPI00389B06A0